MDPELRFEPVPRSSPRGCDQLGVEDRVLVVRRVASGSLVVGLRRQDGIIECLIEEDLRREGLRGVCTREVPHLDVDVDRPPLVPARIDRFEPGNSLLVGQLIATEERLASGVPARLVWDRGIEAERIGLPDVDLGPDARLGRRANLVDRDRKPQRDTFLAGDDIRSIQLLIDEVGPLSRFRAERAVGGSGNDGRARSSLRTV